MTRAIFASAIGSAFVFAACGARTELYAGAEIVTDAGCTTDSSCNDGIDCTLDRCDPTLQVCTHTLRDALCDDGVFCTGVKHCDPTRGCVTTPLSCDDGIACTIDSCNEHAKKCDHVPDDSKCPISQACNPTSGCEQRAFAQDPSTLFDVRLPSGVMTAIGSTGLGLTDVALDPKNVLFGISFDGLAIVNQSTGNAAQTISLTGESLNGADFAPDGTFFVSGGGSLFTLDPQAGTLTTVASFPSGLTSSGDIAFVGSRLLATANQGTSSDALVEFDIGSGTSIVLGDIGFSCVWGLASYGTSLYGFTCNGEIINMDTTTGAATLVQQVSASFWGASAR